MSSSNNLLLKNTFKVTLQYLFNVFILFNTVSYIEITLKLKIDPKMCTFNNLEEIWKIWKKNLKKRVATLIKGFQVFLARIIKGIYLKKS